MVCNSLINCDNCIALLLHLSFQHFPVFSLGYLCVIMSILHLGKLISREIAM